MTATTNAENLRQNRVIFFLIAEQVLAFASHPDVVREVSKFQANCVLHVLHVLRY